MNLSEETKGTVLGPTNSSSARAGFTNVTQAPPVAGDGETPPQDDADAPKTGTPDSRSFTIRHSTFALHRRPPSSTMWPWD